MRNFRIKFFHIFPLFQGILIGCIVLLGLFRWIFTIRFEVLEINQEWFQFWIPFLLPLVPIYFLLRPRLRILTFKNEDQSRYLFLLMAWICTVAPLISSQFWMDTAFGEISEVRKAEEIVQLPKSRFFKIKDYQVVKSATASFTDVHVSGKYSQHLDFVYYFVVPVVSGDTNLAAGKNYSCWYEVKYSDQISNSLPDQEKEEKYKQFYEAHATEFQSHDFHKAQYFEKAGPSDNRDYGFKAIAAKTGNEVPARTAILLPEEESISSRNHQSAKWLGILWLAGIVIYAFALIWPRISLDKPEKITQAENESAKMDLEEIKEFLIPRGVTFCTSILVWILVLAFLASLFAGVHLISPDTSDLMLAGANRRAETTGGEYWRLFTSIFLHAGIIHLALNLGGLLIISSLAEPILGRVKYLLVFIISGLAGSLASILWHDHSASVGASGAIFGLDGAFFALLLCNKIPKEERKALFLMIGGYALINLVMGLIGNIDNAAHIGGLLGGFTITFILMAEVKPFIRYTLACLSLLVLYFLIQYLFIEIPQSQQKFEESMAAYSNLESEALEISTKLSQYGVEEIEKRKQKSLADWQACLKILEEIEKLNITDNQRSRNEVLTRYTQMRVKEFSALYKTYLINAETYNDSLVYYSAEVGKLLKELE